jgi:hypothetical protein
MPGNHTFAQYACHRRDKMFKAALQCTLNIITDVEVCLCLHSGQTVSILQLLHNDTLFSAVTAYMTGGLVTRK